MNSENRASIARNKATHDHFWVINDEFGKDNIMCFDGDWNGVLDDVPIAWPKAKQVSVVGIARD